MRMRTTNTLLAVAILSVVFAAAACGDSASDATIAADAGGGGSSSSGEAGGSGGLQPGAGSDAASDGASPQGTTDGGAPADARTDTGDGAIQPRPGACTPPIVPTPGVQTAHTKGSTCAKLGYLAYVPAAYATRNDWPLIIFFHGDGQRGNGTTDLPLVDGDGLPKDIKAGTWDPGKRFVVLSPQMDDRNGLPERTGGSVNDFVAFAKANYQIDVKRIYLTGLSGGGAPVYNYLGDYAGGEIAAAAPTSGWYSTQGKECTWKQIPIWYFHGNVDNIVPAKDHATKSYETLAACSPAAPIAPRYTLFRDVGHSAWNPAYELTGMNAASYPLVAAPPGTTAYDVPFYDWLLQYKR